MADDEGNMEDVEVPSPEENTSPPAQGGGVNVGGVQIYSAAQLPYAGTLLSAVVLLVALVSGGTYGNDEPISGHKYYGYGIGIACVAMFFALVGWVLSRMENSTLILYNNYFLFVWNFIGACFMTFGGPFKSTGNGYFASWGLVVFALMGLGVNAEQVKQGAAQIGPLLGVFASSLITFVAIISEGFDKNEGELIYTIIVAGISMILSAAFARSEPALYFYPTLAFFAILWIIAASLVTFRGPFLETGNGYFGAWGGAVTTTFAAFRARGGTQETTS